MATSTPQQQHSRELETAHFRLRANHTESERVASAQIQLWMERAGEILLAATKKIPSKCNYFTLAIFFQLGNRMTEFLWVEVAARWLDGWRSERAMCALKSHPFYLPIS